MSCSQRSRIYIVGKVIATQGRSGHCQLQALVIFTRQKRFLERATSVHLPPNVASLLSGCSVDCLKQSWSCQHLFYEANSLLSLTDAVLGCTSRSAGARPNLRDFQNLN